MVRKPLKGTKGYSSRFVPDYEYGAEAMAESEGFGSLGRVEQDLTASEDSCAPKSKCIKLNVDDYDRFGVPIRTFSLSRMSQLEKRDLVVKLKSELELVRLFQRKFYSLGLDSEVFSPASNVHGNYTVPKRPGLVESVPMSKSKKAVAASQKKIPSGRNGSRTKGGPLAGRRFESVKQSARKNTNFDVLTKQCEALLKNVMKQKNAWIFNKPVDIVESNIPDYYSVIKYPMDLGTVKMKLLSNQYSSPLEFAADVRLTFKNAMTYNSPGNAVHIYAATLSRFFESRWKSIEKKIPASTDASTPSKSSVVIESEIASMPPAKKQKIAPTENKLNRKTEKRVMTDIEKKRLGEEVEALLEELPENIIDFLKESTLNGGGQVIEDEIEIDIGTLNDDTLFSLRKLLDDYLQNKEKNQTLGEVEIPNESGFSNPYIQPLTGNAPDDEDVDICGNDLPLDSNLTNMEIDKDTAQRNTKDDSSSSSSSGSHSSSSDSESEGLSAGEADGSKDSAEAGASKVAVASIPEPKKTDLKESYVVCSEISSDCLNGHTEQNFSSIVTSNEPNCHQEEESVPHDRPVSPDKLYRAAILRSRFADIILKVQENNLEKGETPGTGKLKGEREELERWRREEKSRLQAEAKALEENRKRAEAKAEEEVRRKRELEREAARLALQKMEKTVDINENSRFMEDLEMFRSAPDEHLQSGLVEDASPENSQIGFDSFKFQASGNPLEQLGLFMKMDEDEGVEQQSTPSTSNNRLEEEMD
ncbi:transcription factor GTE10-like isoform X1 [Primulina eburnea]|uniref:transcription factor GTE10-like isoform X1 n=1 Tax=Primulina eburnea TaxID=1245227 RepID=UPI003C6C9F03